ncbi:MAG: hypothetical protein KDC95_04890 [Planctomycetes bacterium]|nr:hypothetical protein [Planctomycetota bacterium]
MLTLCKAISIAIAAFVVTHSLHAQRARLVYDVNAAAARPNLPNSRIPILVAGGLTYYVLGDAATGTELWASDSSNRSYLVKDIQPGPASSRPSLIGSLGSRMVFEAWTPNDGLRLWITDGTESGTRRVPDSRSQAIANPLPSSGSAVIGAHLYFVTSSEYRYDVYRTDGTSIEALTQFKVRSSYAPRGLRAFGSELFFLFDDQSQGFEWWYIDTAARTPTPAKLVAVIAGAWSSLTIAGSYVWFSGWSSANGNELYGFDRNSQKLTAFDLLPGPGDSSPWKFVTLSGRAFFLARTSLAFASYEVWTSDGTLTGTKPLVTSQPIAEVSKFEAAAGRLFFDSATTGKTYMSDGTAAGTLAVEDARMLAVDSTYLWTLDTVRGNYARRRLGDPYGFIFLTAKTQTPNLEGQLGANGDLWFVVNNENWISSGTASSTSRFDPTSNGRTESSYPRSLMALGQRCIFVATDAGGRRALWITDGRTNGTWRITPPLSISTIRDREDIAVFDGRAWFALHDLGGREVWWSDGAQSGPTILTDLNPQGSSDPEHFVATGRALWFWATDPAQGRELFRTDGTAAGTRLAVDLTTGPGDTDVESMWAVGERLFFYRVNTNGIELLSSDGTASSTHVLAAPTDKGSLLGVTKDGCFVLETNASGAWSVLFTDGTVQGTHVVDRQSGIEVAPAGAVLPKSNAIVVAKSDGLWRIDPTAKSLLASGRYFDPITVQDRAVGLRMNPTEEVYISDATVAGTQAGPSHLASLLRGTNHEQLRGLGTSRMLSVTRNSPMLTSGLATGSTQDHALATELESTQAVVAGGKLFVDASLEYGSELYVVDDFGPESAIVSRGCGTGIRTPTLTATPPTLGLPMALEASSLRNGDVAVLLAGIAADVRIPGGCTVLVDLTSTALLLPALAFQGDASWTVPLPWGAQFLGLQVRWQVLSVTPSANLRALETTNGLDSLLRP